MADGNDKEPGAQNKGESPASPHTYTFRLMQPEDAEGVVRCFREAYGDTYPTAYCYDPAKLVELNRVGALISAVAIADLTGEVVGHSAVQRYGSSANAEIGFGVVVHAHRKGSLTIPIIEVLVQGAVQRGIRRLVGHSVTNHPAMQILSARLGFTTCALALGAMPASTTFKKINEQLTQRESCVLDMKFCVPPEPVMVCPPKHHRAMVERIYEAVGKPATFRSLPESSGAGQVEIRINHAWSIADIHVRRIGTETAAEIWRHLSELTEVEKIDIVYLELPLDQGGIDGVCGDAEAAGFFFAGLSHSSAADDRESLFLQHPNTKIDMSSLVLATPMAREIFDYVVKERQRLHC
jgi:hypothetical protein